MHLAEILGYGQRTAEQRELHRHIASTMWRVRGLVLEPVIFDQQMTGCEPILPSKLTLNFAVVVHST
jgi:hypothetical protein